jgi:hypothetical protein
MALFLRTTSATIALSPLAVDSYLRGMHPIWRLATVFGQLGSWKNEVVCIKFCKSV